MKNKTTTLLIAGLLVAGLSASPCWAESAPSFLEWAQSNSLSSAGFLEMEDPDGDGLVNLVEFASGTDPNQPSAMPMGGYTDIGTNGLPAFFITYPRQGGGTGTAGVDYSVNGLDYWVELTDSLNPVDWQGNTGQVFAVGDPVPEGGGIERVVLQIEDSGLPTGFSRVRIKTPYAHMLDDFETGLPGWVPIFGTPTLSTAQAHSGLQSYFVDEDQDLIRRTFSELEQGTVIVWFYDDAADLSMETFATLSDSSNGNRVRLGVCTDCSVGFYSYEVPGGAPLSSTVPRSTGWHEFKFEATGFETLLYIDGTLIASASGIALFDAIDLGDELADGKTGTVYFDLAGIQILNDQSAASLPILGELLLNGGFEEGTLGWTESGSHAIDTSTVHGGTNALQYVATHTYAGVQTVNIVAGRAYTISGWMKADSSLSNYARLSLEFFDMNGTSVGSVSKVGGVTVRPGYDWTKAAQQITAPSTAVKMKVMLRTYSSSGTCWFDDISLTPSGWYAPGVVPAPENPPLAGTWTPTFEENFNGNELDGTQWKMGHHWLLNGLAGLASDAILVSNGVLTLRASLDPVFFGGSVRDFSSGEVSTYKRFRQLYGYFEVRMRYAAKLGMWPAFWTMPDRGIYGNQNNNYKPYIKFDLAGSSDPVASAEIRLRVKAVETGSNIHRAINIFPVGDNWSESTLTWNNMPLEKPLWISHDYEVAPAVGDELVYDLTDYVNEQLAGDQVVSIVIYDTFSRTSQITFGSRESAASGDRPRLVLDGVVVEAVEDTYARGGSYANSNYGNSTSLIMQEEWGNNNSIADGGMEMDIMEALGVWGAYKFQNALHWDYYGTGHPSTGFTFVDPAFSDEEYHTYGMYWEAGLIEFYVDGALTGTYNDARACSVSSYLILSLQMGGWNGNDDTANYSEDDYPADMDVDYVKVWSGTKQ